jgi:hypothetical protein
MTTRFQLDSSRIHSIQKRHAQTHRGHCQAVASLERKLDETLEVHWNEIGWRGTPDVAHEEDLKVRCVRCDVQEEPLSDRSSDGQMLQRLGQEPGRERREVTDVHVTFSKKVTSKNKRKLKSSIRNIRFFKKVHQEQT